jgi:hypothetical protein
VVSPLVAGTATVLVRASVAPLLAALLAAVGAAVAVRLADGDLGRLAAGSAVGGAVYVLVAGRWLRELVVMGRKAGSE